MAGWSDGGWKNGRRRGVAGKSVWQGGMEDAPENGKESPHSVHANGLIDWLIDWLIDLFYVEYIILKLMNSIILLAFELVWTSWKWLS